MGREDVDLVEELSKLLVRNGGVGWRLLWLGRRVAKPARRWGGVVDVVPTMRVWIHSRLVLLPGRHTVWARSK